METAHDACTTLQPVVGPGRHRLRPVPSLAAIDGARHAQPLPLRIRRHHWWDRSTSAWATDPSDEQLLCRRRIAGPRQVHFRCSVLDATHYRDYTGESAPDQHLGACGKTRTERPVVFWCSTAIPQLSRSHEGPFETGGQAVSLQLPTGQGCRCGRWDGQGAEGGCVVCRPRGGRKRHRKGTRFPRASRHVDHPRAQGENWSLASPEGPRHHRMPSRRCAERKETPL